MRFRSQNLQNEGGTGVWKPRVDIDHEYATVAHNVAQFCRTAPNVMPGSHLRRLVIFVASYLVILSHSVCDFGLVISVDFFIFSIHKDNNYIIIFLQCHRQCAVLCE